jgi:D-glycero-D-manno-heptose 1,7-bisphosphate phosphatase
VPHLSVICPCRKPAPGMLLQAAHDLDLALPESWMIGDSACDIGAGCRAGTRTALIDTQPLAAVTPDVHRATTAAALSQVLDTTYLDTIAPGGGLVAVTATRKISSITDTPT